MLFVNVTVIGALGTRTGWPGKVKEVGPIVTGCTPVPFRLSVCGLVIRLSVIVMDPVYGPVAVGVDVTLMVQVPRAATLVPQVFVWLKPTLATILVIGKAEVGLSFVNVTVIGALGMPIGWLAKVKEVGLSVTGAVPVPVRLYTWGDPEALLSVTVRVPLSVPMTVGVNVTPNVQVAPACSAAGQLLLITL